MHLSYDPSIPHSVEIGTYVYKNTYIRMLIASLFIIEKNLKQMLITKRIDKKIMI